jgi:hypothetical protein
LPVAESKRYRARVAKGFRVPLRNSGSDQPLSWMTFLKTVLAAVAICVALLVWADFAIGPERPGTGTASGLTAAAVLASDGMTPDGRPGEPALDRAALGRLTGAISDGKQAASAGTPTG